MTEAKEIISKIKEDKKFKNMNVRLGNDPDLIIKKLPFDVTSLDDLLVGGIPIGKFTLLYGESSVGKTFLLQKLVASAQKRGMSIVYIDVDKTYEPDWWNTITRRFIQELSENLLNHYIARLDVKKEE